jgi:hypothetical protein
MAKPPGLKTFPKLLSQKEVDLIVANDEYTKNPGDVLFRYYGDFGHNTPEPTTPPKADAPIRRGAPGKETPPPSPWMLAWGKTLQDRGFFDEMPNQYRVTDWFGSLCAQFKWHIDNHRHGERILAISLSNNRVIGFRKDANSPVFELEQHAGDAYLIAGPIRWSWQHCVLPRGKDKSGGRSFVVSFKRPAQ